MKKQDPLEIIIVPHSVVEWQKKQGLLVKKLFPESLLKGRWAVYHGKIRLRRTFKTIIEVEGYVLDIIGDKKKCWENKRIFKIKELK